MNFRPLGPEDAPAYHALRRRALAEAPQFVGPMGEREALGDLAELEARLAGYPREGVQVLGCFLEDHCVAAAGLNRYSNPKYSHVMFLWGMYVLPEHRGRSVGHQLLRELLALARAQHGVSFVKLQVTATNETAKALYRRHGFVLHGVEPNALRVGDCLYDFEIMQARL